MKIPTFSWVFIAKNEEHNIHKLAESIEGTYDEVIFVDTGSTDKTVEIAESLGWRIFHFPWIRDFSAARNFGIKQVQTEYWGWLDLDDSLSSKENFNLFKATVMALHDYFYAPYWYSFNELGQPTCRFTRERIFRANRNLRFSYFIHEAIKPESVDGKPVSISMIQNWHVNHRRTNADLCNDHGRNLSYLEENLQNLDGRMSFYYGKELFDTKNVKKAKGVLEETLGRLDLHDVDRLMATQYAAHACLIEKDIEGAIKYAMMGLRLDPQRAELFCILGDAYLMANNLDAALVYLNAAKSCKNRGGGHSPVFTLDQCYCDYPSLNIAKIHFNQGNFKEAEKAIDGVKTPDAKALYADIAKALSLVEKKRTTFVQDIVITCAPGGVCEWDSEIYKHKGLGGSETAAVEMATWLRKLTGKPVKVFHSRKQDFIDDWGVEYLKVEGCQTYFQNYVPSLHIAWRHTHNFGVKTYVWSHDLLTPGFANLSSRDRILCLSDFHQRYFQANSGLAVDRFIKTKNGIEPKRFIGKPIEKVYGRVVWSNSPDRGLEHAILIMDKVRETTPEAHLEVYYGFENLEKYGLKDLADKLKAMISERPWIKYVGNVQQDILMDALRKAQVWLYPATFIETFCISALEALACKAYPVVRSIGALQNTLEDADSHGWADLVECSEMDENAINMFAVLTENAIIGHKSELIDYDPINDSWENVAKSWIEKFDLK